MKVRIPLLFAVAALATSCASTSKLPPNSPVSIEENETVVILGVLPSYQVVLGIGSADGDYWNAPSSVGFSPDYPENGYVVSKVRATGEAESYGVVGIMPRGFAGYRFVPCAGDKMLTFQAPAGKVIYIGDIHYDLDLQTGDKLSYEHALNPDKARQFLSSYYPDLASKMETQEAKELVSKLRECDRPMLVAAGGVMIPIPRFRKISPNPTRTYYPLNSR